jgi:hypothetical protein
MKIFVSRVLFCSLLGCALASAGASQGRRMRPGAAAPYSGSGRIRQLNYGPDGAVNGFLLGNGTLAMLPPFTATNSSPVRVGASVRYSGYARNTMSGRTVVDVQTLSINGQTLNMTDAGAPPPSPPPAAGPAPVGGPDEPPPPPPPPQAGPPQF